jgi:glutaminase
MFGNTGKIKSLLAGCLALSLLSVTAPLQADVDYQKLVEEAHALFKDNDEGANANYIPVLDEVDSSLFGVVIVTRDGKTYAAGDVDHQFSIQSVAKPFTAALVMEAQGIDAIRDKIGVEPTGMPFNSITAIEMNDKRSRNPYLRANCTGSVVTLDKPHRGCAMPG